MTAERQDDGTSKRFSELEEGVVFMRVRGGTSIDRICEEFGLSEAAALEILDRVVLRLGYISATGQDPFALDPLYTHHLHDVEMDEAAFLDHLRSQHGYTRPAEASFVGLRELHAFAHRGPPAKPA